MTTEIRRKDARTFTAQRRAQLVDVRPAVEYEREHIPHAISLPLEAMTLDALKLLEREKPVIVYSSDCQCDLSARAASRLEGMGFLEVFRYSGGQADWLAAGWETEGRDSRKQRIGRLVETDVPTCSIRERLEDVRRRRLPGEDICVVVNDKGIVLGSIQGDTWWEQDHQARVVDVMQPGPRTIRPHLEPKEAHSLLQRMEAASVIVTTSDGELVGLLRAARIHEKSAA
jgi:rhodanese-related sulfurtransferase